MLSNKSNTLDLSAAEIGIIHDKDFFFLVLLLDFAVKGFLNIDVLYKNSKYNNKMFYDYRLNLLKTKEYINNSDDLKDYEKYILKKIFPRNQGVAYLSKLCAPKMGENALHSNNTNKDIKSYLEELLKPNKKQKVYNKSNAIRNIYSDKISNFSKFIERLEFKIIRYLYDNYYGKKIFISKSIINLFVLLGIFVLWFRDSLDKGIFWIFSSLLFSFTILGLFGRVIADIVCILVFAKKVSEMKEDYRTLNEVHKFKKIIKGFVDGYENTNNSQRVFEKMLPYAIILEMLDKWKEQSSIEEGLNTPIWFRSFVNGKKEKLNLNDFFNEIEKFYKIG